MEFLEFVDIDKSYGKNIVISKFNLRVEKGKLLVLLGPSGCGKSTLLRMVAGLEKVDNGKIFLDGKLVATIPNSIPLNPTDNLTTGDEGLNGGICNIIFYDRRLTKKKIEFNYELLKNKNPPVL